MVNLPPRRDMSPKTPKIRLCSLILGRRSNRHNDVLTRVQRCRHPPDRAAFACGIIAFKYGNQ